ncbi:alpha/beta fold hydrolase [Streptomyces sp. NPDC001435]|uniref:alpha/beta fold hydrolase n=1 Tax=unclassified Streptomyces TaxID=2593676 RepID=UPI00369570A2
MIRPPEPSAPVVLRRHSGAAAAGAPRILFLHGLAGTDTVWDETARQLGTDDYDIWSAALPWRGQGVTGWGRSADLTPWVEEALVSVPGPVDVVVTHSMSSNVLLELLDRTAESDGGALRRFGIRALVLVSPFYRASAEEFDWSTITHYLNNFHLILQEGIRAHSGGRVSTETEAAMAERVREWIGPYGWIRFFDLFLRTPELLTARITVPCLVIGGTHDIATPSEHAVALADALPDARLRVLDGSGHFPMVDERAAFGAELRTFLDSVLQNPPVHQAPLTTLTTLTTET